MLRSIMLLALLPMGALADAVDDAREAYLAGEYETALATLRPAAEGGDPNAQNILGDAYDSGNGVAVDHAEALRWWELSAAQGFDKAQYNLGLLYENGRPDIAPDPRRALEYYAAAMEAGNADAATNIGYLYESGALAQAPSFGPQQQDTSESDLMLAAEHYEIGVELGSTQAMTNLGTLIVTGSGIDEDMGRAMALFREAGALGDNRALSNLGAMYENGYATAPDPLAAFALYAMAARGGHPQAAVNMGWMLYEGTAPGGAPSDPALPLAYCWWGMDMDVALNGGSESTFAGDCGALAEGLDDAAMERAGDLADQLVGGGAASER